MKRYMLDTNTVSHLLKGHSIIYDYTSINRKERKEHKEIKNIKHSLLCIFLCLCGSTNINLPQQVAIMEVDY